MSFQKSKNVPTTVNGLQVIGIVKGKRHLGNSFFDKMIDNNDELFFNKEADYHIGLYSAWGMQTKESVPMISKLLQTGSEILVRGFKGGFTFDKPFYDSKAGLKTTMSTVAEAGDLPGIDESTFDIVLSEKCYPNEILCTDPYGEGEQLFVVESNESEMNGNGWRTTVTLTSGNKEDYYDVSLLEKDILYYKINVVNAEFDSSFGGVDMPTGNPTGYIRTRFQLGGIRGVEGEVTAFADAFSAGLPTAKATDGEKAMYKMQEKYANGNTEADTIMFGTKLENGKIDYHNTRATSLMEYLVEETLTKRTNTSHLWQKGGVIKSKNGGITHLNEGVWHQLRRGKLITIPKVMGTTKVHVADAVNYLYLENPDLPWQEREVMFEVGRLMEQNMLLIFQKEIQDQFTRLQNSGVLTALFGDTGVLDSKLRNSLVTGSALDNLQLASLIQFTSVALPGIAGKVTFRYNPALNNLSGNSINNRGNFANGDDWTSHSAIIWDVKSREYSNNYKNIDGASTISGETKLRENLYLVRPEGGMTWKGSENGRWDRGKTRNIIASNKKLMQGFWAFNSSSMVLLNPDRAVMLELSKGARRNGLSF